MKLKYRIKSLSYRNKKLNAFLAQYRMLRIWMTIGLTRGYLIPGYGCYCKSIEEAKTRVDEHKRCMQRAGTDEAFSVDKEIVWED